MVTVTQKTPWVFVDKHENLVACGEGIQFVYPWDVPEAYAEFAAAGDDPDEDAHEKLAEAVEQFLARSTGGKTT